MCPFWGGYPLKVHYLLYTTYPSDMFPSRRISSILTTCPNVGLFLASAFQHSSMLLYTGSGQSYSSRNTLMFIHKYFYWASCYIFNHVSNVTDTQYEWVESQFYLLESLGIHLYVSTYVKSGYLALQYVSLSYIPLASAVDDHCPAYLEPAEALV